MPNTDARAALETLHTIAPHPPPRTRWPLVVLGLAMILLSITSLRLASAVSVNSERSQANRDAIRVSCTLLANVIVQSGGGSAAPDSPAARPTAQQRLNALYVSVLTGHMTPGQRRRARDLQTAIGSSGSDGISVPDCQRVADRPDTVTAIQTAP